jgi:zinc transport system ATP-binding protein
MNETEAVSLHDVSFAYDVQPVLQDVNLEVRAGEFMAVLGPNGGGKTTLLKLILGLLTPDKGVVRVFGQEPSQARGRVGYVPQHAVIQPDFPITVREVVLLGQRTGPRPGFLYGRKARDLANQALERVDMLHLAERRMDQLSGGQRQRALVARALVGSPQLLVFDEPTANIDPQGKLCLYELLDSLRKDITIILVSHDLIVASVQVTAVAAVNRRLVAGHDNRLTPEMLALIYGAHRHSCPMDGALQDAPGMLQRAVLERVPHVHGEEKPR